MPLGHDSTYSGTGANFPAGVGGWAGAGSTAASGGILNGVYGYTDAGNGNGVVGYNSNQVSGSGNGVYGLAFSSAGVTREGRQHPGDGRRRIERQRLERRDGGRGHHHLDLARWVLVRRSRHQQRHRRPRDRRPRLARGRRLGVYGSSISGVGVFGSGGSGTGLSGTGSIGVSASGTGIGLIASGIHLTKAVKNHVRAAWFVLG